MKSKLLILNNFLYFFKKLYVSKNAKYIILIKIYPGDKIKDNVVNIGHNRKLSEKYANNRFIKVKITSKLKQIQVLIDTGLHK